MELNQLESAVLFKLLDGDHPILAALRTQVPLLSVAARELTGVGFFADFAVADPAVAAPTGSHRLVFGDVQADVPGLQHGAGFLLYVENGLLAMLEGYSYDEPWPQGAAEFTLRYSQESRQALLEQLGRTRGRPDG